MSSRIEYKWVIAYKERMFWESEARFPPPPFTILKAADYPELEREVEKWTPVRRLNILLLRGYPNTIYPFVRVEKGQLFTGYPTTT